MESNHQIFEDLFVLELASNHWGDVDRGLKIINDFSKVVHKNDIKAAIKLQFRDVNSFIHEDYKTNRDIRYIKKVTDTSMSADQYKILVDAIKECNCIPMSTPFDEKSVALCELFDLPIIKIASSDMNDWPLIECIAKTRKPVIASLGGASLEDTDALIDFFKQKNIPISINHCVSIYPSEDSELDLHQIDFLKKRYPDLVIGFSSHEYTDWESSVMIAYAKGARTFERHIDIDDGCIPVSSYCTLPEQADRWFKAFNKAKEMCGAEDSTKRVPPQKEVQYLDALVRGIYAKRDLPKGYMFTQESFNDDLYMAIPLMKGQLSCREIKSEELQNTCVLTDNIQAHAPIKISEIEYSSINTESIRELIYKRGL